MKKIVLLTEVSEDAFTVDLTKISQCQINSLMAAAHKGITEFYSQPGAEAHFQEWKRRTEARAKEEGGRV